MEENKQKNLMSKAFFRHFIRITKKASVLSFVFFFAVSPVLAQEVPAVPVEEPTPIVEETVLPLDTPVVPPADTPIEPVIEPVVEAPLSYTLSYSAGVNGSLTGTALQVVESGADGTPVTAVADTGYVFSDWSDGLVTNPRTDLAVLVDMSVTANFIAVTPDPAEEVVSVEETENYAADFELYKKYILYQKYEKKDLYKKYLRYKELAAKYPWENKKAEKKALKKLKNDYKKYRKNPTRYARYSARASDYLNYGALKAEYFASKQYAGYSDNARYDKPEYDSYREYGTEEYKAGYDRYVAALAQGLVTESITEEVVSKLGPDIAVGLYTYIPRDLKDASFSIKANRPFKVKDRKNKVVGEIPADTKVRVKYLGGDDRNFRVYYSTTDVDIDIVSKEVRFVSDDQYENDIVFDISRPDTAFDRYRGSIRLRYYDSPVADGDRVWVINRLPLEHYVWGMGEITGTGPSQYNRVMTTIFRTYGYWKIQWSTKYADQGFKVDATSGSQIYRGYDWEVTHTDIREAALATEGKLILYQGEVALTPYSSWTDGKTRRFEDGHWGHACDKSSSSSPSKIYPWLNSVPDPRGKNETLNTCELAARGNHMVGLSANGAVRMAKYDNSTYDQILQHYYSSVAVARGY